MSNSPAFGDVIVFPLLQSNGQPHPVYAISWSQLFSTRKQDYYAISAKDAKTKTTVAFFVQKDMLDAGVSQFATVVETPNGEFMPVNGDAWPIVWMTGKIGKATLNDKFQYGQKDANGTDRFIVYHDQNNKPYQHRILHTAQAMTELDKARGVINGSGMDGNGTAKALETIATNFVGDYLHTFQAPAAMWRFGYTEEAERRAKDLELEADKLWTSFVADFEMVVKEEKLRWDRLLNSTGKFGVNAAKAGLEAVRKDETVWRAAEGGLQDGEAAGYEALKSAIVAAGTLVDIQRMELKGTLRASSDYCDPFDILVEGVIAGKAFKFEGKWNPNETGELIADVCGKAVKAIVGL